MLRFLTIFLLFLFNIDVNSLESFQLKDKRLNPRYNKNNTVPTIL